MPLITARLSGDRCINLYNGTSFKVCIYSPERIVGYSIVQEPGENDADPRWLCYLITDDSKLYKVHQHMIKGHRISENTPVNSDEIFSDLLSEVDETDGIELQRATQLVLVLESRDIILTLQDRPVGLCAGDKLIVVTCQHGPGYTVNIYNTIDDDSKASSQKLTDPVRTFTFPTDCHKSKNSHSKYSCYTSVSKKGILMKIVVSEFQKHLPYVSTDNVSVGISLYKHLFGQDMALNEVPVLLLAPFRGSVYFLPLNSHIIDTHKSSIMAGERSVSGSWRLLCQTSTPVVGAARMGLSACKTSTGDAPCESCTGTLDQKTEAQDAIVFCCSDGALKVFHHDITTSTIKFSSVVVRDPIITMCSYHNRLYHSTGTHLYETVLHCVTSSGPDVRTRVAVSSSLVFHHAGVTELSCRTQDGCIDHAASPCTLELTLDSAEIKQLNSKDLKNRGNSKMCGGHDWASTSDEKTTQSGTIIRDTLKAIEHVDTARSNAQKRLDTQSYWLTQVSTIAYLLRQNVWTSWPNALDRIERNRGITHSKNTTKLPFHCVFKSRVVHSDGEATLYLDGEITNLMATNLTPDWSLQLTIVPPSGVSDIPHVTKTQRLVREMKRNDSVILSVRVSPQLIMCGFEMLTSAVLSVPDCCFQGQAAGRDRGSPVFLSADIGHEYIDILYFMLPDTTTWQHHRAGLQEGGGVYRCIQALARDRPAAAMLLQDTVQEMRLGQVDVRCEAFITQEVYTQLEESYGTGIQGVFGYLLASSPCGSMADISTDSRLITVLGHPVHMTIVVSTGESTAAEKEIIKVAVRVTADVNIAACIHKAVLQKLQVLQVSHRPDIHVRDVRKQLEQAQELEQLIATMQQARTPHQPEEVAKLYQQLRSVRLKRNMILK